MVSPGLLFLLLMSSFLHSSSSAGSSEVQSKAKDVVAAIKDYGVPFLGLIPIHGSWISAVASLALGATGMALGGDDVLKTLKSEFESLNIKLDKHKDEQIWEIWKAAKFSGPEMKITLKWEDYLKIFNILKDNSKANDKKMLTAKFIKEYSEDETRKIHKYLTIDKVSFIKNLRNSLVEHVNCHEKDIRDYSLLINSLIYKGNTMTYFKYKVQKSVPSNLRSDLAKIAHESAKAMFQIYENCLANSETYIKKDVEELITRNNQRHQLAHSIRSVLAQTFDRYDWMVVVYLTKNSKHGILGSLNKHVLNNVFYVEKNEVTVALARQVKGTHTKPDKVKRAIERCIHKTLECHKVADTLSKCKEKVDGFDISKTYTAVHAYLDKSHDSYDAKEAPDQFLSPADNTVPYFYKGTCKKYKVNHGGHFFVLIKSDEEIENQDPCSKLQCGDPSRGKCVTIKKMPIAVCECNEGYYGKNCENSMEDYMRD